MNGCKLRIFLALLLLPLCVYAQDEEPVSFMFGNISFSLTPRILEDGSMTDFSFGMMYSGSMGLDIQLRGTQIAKNEEIGGTDDSLNAIKETVYEVFVLPVQYHLVQKDNVRVMAGGGLYYEYDKLNEKGFFTLDFLEELDPPMERVNSYKNDFTMHLVGPLLNGKVFYNAEWYKLGFTAGVVPIFHTSFTQKLRMEPLLHPSTADLAENNWGSPYFYLSLDAILFKYVNTTFSYNYAKLNKKVIDFDGDLNWIYPEQSVLNQSIMIEVSGLLPVGQGLSFQVGYGYMHNFISLDSDAAIEEGKHYVIVSTKRMWF